MNDTYLTWKFFKDSFQNPNQITFEQCKESKRYYKIVKLESYWIFYGLKIHNRNHSNIFQCANRCAILKWKGRVCYFSGWLRSYVKHSLTTPLNRLQNMARFLKGACYVNSYLVLCDETE